PPFLLVLTPNFGPKSPLDRIYTHALPLYKPHAIGKPRVGVSNHVFQGDSSSVHAHSHHHLLVLRLSAAIGSSFRLRPKRTNCPVGQRQYQKAVAGSAGSFWF